jgi:hypothetical protein
MTAADEAGVIASVPDSSCTPANGVIPLQSDTQDQGQGRTNNFSGTLSLFDLHLRPYYASG